MTQQQQQQYAGEISACQNLATTAAETGDNTGTLGRTILPAGGVKQLGVKSQLGYSGVEIGVLFACVSKIKQKSSPDKRKE